LAKREPASRHPRQLAEPAASLFARAFTRHQAGDLHEAGELYRRVLILDPRHADSLHMLGLSLAQSGKPEDGARLIGQALVLRPDLALAHYNLGNILRTLERGEEAVLAYRRAIGLEPNSPRALVNLGVTLRSLGRVGEAVEAYHRALTCKPDYAEAHYNLGVALQGLGHNKDAVETYRRAVALKPDLADAYANLGACLLSLDRPVEAVGACESRIALEPASAEAHVCLSAALLEAGRAQQAVGAASRAAVLEPENAEAHICLGNGLRELGRLDQAASAYERAVRLDPASARAWVNLGIARQEAGHRGEAVQAIDHALAIDPGSAAAWSVRGGLKTFKAHDPDITTLRDILDSAHARGAGLEDRLNLEFTLGKAFMDIGEADAAFAHLDAGNRLKRASLLYDVRDDAAQFAVIVRGLDAPRLDRLAGGGDPSDRPVFLVGMPRSGTTLMEQILASHPQVWGAGELATLEELLIERLGRALSPGARAARLPDLSPGDLAAMGSDYVRRIATLAPDAARVTDKMPANFRFAGLIRLMLPNARIVHCRRDPLDTCLSCYATKFSRGQPFAYDLRDLGSYYRAYEALMQHWRACLPTDRFIEVRYEDVVGDLEGQARRLVDFCGLPWDDACLRFHKDRRQVRTASVNQVRQPLYRTSVARWKTYERHLGPLVEALG
jgi:tetratricopeptide (TPR) repeat protein